MRILHSRKYKFVLIGLAVGISGLTQEPPIKQTTQTCPPVLANTFSKTEEMIQKVNEQAVALGLAGWPSIDPAWLLYGPFEKPCFKDPKLDKVWCPRVAYWNLSNDGLRFSAILLMKDLRPTPKRFDSDLEYYEAVHVEDAFGNAKVSKIGVRIHNLYRASYALNSARGFPKFIGSGATFEFEDTHDEAGLSSRYVFNPQMGLAIAGMRLETKREHLSALKAEEGETEMGDSPGHAGECPGFFAENIKTWKEQFGYIWIDFVTQRYAFPLSELPKLHRQNSVKGRK